MKLVITYDVDVDALEEDYREYLADRKDALEYCEETGNLLRKGMYEKNMPWLNFEDYIRKVCFNDYDMEELEDYEFINNRKMELKNEEEA
jgi:hypothetical protein